VLRQLKTVPWFDRVFYLVNAEQAFDASGTLIDPGLQQRLREYLEGFSKFVAAQRRA
jgi:hypothetical protein